MGIRWWPWEGRGWKGVRRTTDLVGVGVGVGVVVVSGCGIMNERGGSGGVGLLKGAAGAGGGLTWRI